ncbi:MAG: hypothetical protein CM1200mP23_2000 [Nitrososphaerota archaeon]|nr:MAG: hypothetical protein CM1200mP23_2000 [Nitrososphaerota archaeon]
MGYTSSLVAMEIEPDKLESVAHQINKHPGVSQTMKENMSSTMVYFGCSSRLRFGKGVREVFKVRWNQKDKNASYVTMFKIGVKLDMVDDKKHDVKPSEEKKKVTDVKFVPTEEDKGNLSGNYKKIWR